MDGEAKVAPRELGEAALRDLVEAAFDALVITHGGTVVFANRSFVQMYGGSAEDIIGTSVIDFVAPECRDFVIAKMSQPSEVRYEAVGLRRDGTRIEVEICAHSGTYAGKPARISAIRYITERKLAEQLLRRSEEQLRRLIERIRDIIVVERQGEIVFANAAALQYLGYADVAAITGTKVLEHVHPGDRAGLSKRWSEPDDATVPLVTVRLVRRDGSIGTVEIATAAMDELDGAPANVVLARDISERQRMEARLVQVDMLSSIGTLAAGIAHEINNPLSYVTLNLGAMARKLTALRTAHEGSDPASVAALCRELEELLTITRDGAERVQQIVRDVRVFARGSVQTRSPIELPRVLDSTIQLAQNSIRHRAHLIRDYAPAPHVDADEPRLGQLFLNLLINALQAFDDDDRRAEIRVRITTAPNGAAIVEIADTGRGIAADELGRVFEPFFTTKAPGVGTGLGLPICRSIVSSLGGTIDIESTPGQGTCCRVVLPATAGSASAEPPSPLEAPRRPARLRMLLVDDEPMLLRALSEELGEEHDVTCAASGDEAIALLMSRDFDVVVCDVMMPIKSGIDVFKAVRQAKPGLEQRFVFMTGGAFTPATRNVLVSLPNPKLEKPFSYEELYRAIALVL